MHNVGVHFSLLLSSEGARFGVIVAAILARCNDTGRSGSFRNERDIRISDRHDEWRRRGGTLEDERF